MRKRAALISDHDVARVAAEADVDQRTARRLIVDGERPRSRATGRALVAALRALGFASVAKRAEAVCNG